MPVQPPSADRRESPMSPDDRREIESLPGNGRCADCGSRGTHQWASVTFGTLICMSCSGLHRGLGVHISRVKSTAMDSWTGGQVQRMKVGGNDSCTAYLASRGLRVTGINPRDKYDNRVAMKYVKVLDAVAEGREPPADDDDDGDAAGGNKGGSGGGGDDGGLAIMARMDAANESLTWQDLFLPVLSVQLDKFYMKKYVPIALAIVGASVFAGLKGMLPDHLRGVHLSFSFALILPIVGILKRSVDLSKAYVVNRQKPFNSARNALTDRIKGGRAMRKESYDLYFPPAQKKEDGTDLRDIPAGLILYPADLVDQTAYAPIAGNLSDEGVLVAVASLEPLRFPTSSSSADGSGIGGKDGALKVMYEVLSQNHSNVTDWALGGHSVGGGSNAFNLARKMRPGVARLVLWGSGTIEGKVGTLGDGSGAPVDVLVIDASNDGLVESAWASGDKRFRSILPPPIGEGGKSRGSTTHVLIEGGNHSSFAHYGPQTYPRADGQRSITMDEQQEHCVKATADFLLGRRDDLKRKND